MIDADLYWMIREFAGSSITEQIHTDIRFHGKIVASSKFVEVGAYVFRVERECTCDDKCGGIFCEPILFFNMIGLKSNLVCEIVHHND